MDSGYYQFIFPSSDSVKAVIELVYVPHTTRYQNIGEVRDEPSLPTKIKLNEEQICDFVRKLGFMDVEGDSQYLNNHFLHLNQVVIANVYTQVPLIREIFAWCKISLFFADWLLQK